ncbi:unnamed protein product, partial [Heterosigma akashiwo]
GAGPGLAVAGPLPELPPGGPPAHAHGHHPPGLPAGGRARDGQAVRGAVRQGHAGCAPEPAAQ